MRKGRCKGVACVFLAAMGLVSAGLSGVASAQPQGPRGVPEAATRPADAFGAATQPGAQPAKGAATQPAQGAATRSEQIEGLNIDPAAGYVEVEAELIQRKVDWLELLATTPGSREYESLLTIKPKPRHIHLGLLMLGLEPGRPMDSEKRGDEWVTKPPKGPLVSLWLIYQEEGQRKKVPANEWVLNREKNQTLKHNRWLFTGSVFAEFQGERFYLADRTGSVISLVAFGDDVLSRDTTVTNCGNPQQLRANTPKLPPKGTIVTIRLKPVKHQAPAPAPQADNGS